jgi:alanine dehydrogenase
VHSKGKGGARMIIGVPKEIKKEEYRVGITPNGVEELKRDGHTVLVELSAGEESGFPDGEYRQAGADTVGRDALFDRADLIVKVKEPVPPEYGFFREKQAVFTFLHLASNRDLMQMLVDRRLVALAYETLEDKGSLPLLAPMSEIAGRMAPLVGAYYLQRVHKGTGTLPMGAAGVKPAKALVLGAGVVGTNAARYSIGLGMETVVVNRGIERLREIDRMFMGRIKTLPLTRPNVETEIRDADLVVGALLVPGGRTPLVITRDMLGRMKKGAVIVDVSVDQGGCAETSRPTTHNDPVYESGGILHYAVANMPGAYPRTSTMALTNVTLPYIRMLAGMGIAEALKRSASMRSALNVFDGEIVHEALVESLGMPSPRIDLPGA